MSRLVPIELIEAVRNRQAVAFCGAGLSSLAGLPTGADLAHGLAERIDPFDGNRDDLTEVATTYAAQRGRHALISYLIEKVGSGSPQPTPTHEELCRLPFAAFVTTNWDDLIERTLLSVGSRPMTVVSDSDVPFLGGQRIPVVKLHGTIARPATITVTERDYYDLLALQPGVAALMANYFATHTVLFLGFGLYDPDFRRLYHACTLRFGSLRRRAYAVQLNTRRASAITWREEQLEIIESNAEDFVATLVSASRLDN